MAINLTKGGNVNLSKEAPGIAKTTLGLGWNPRVTDGQACDLDAIAFLLKADGKVGYYCIHVSRSLPLEP